jgi:hypothetical protein
MLGMTGQHEGDADIDTDTKPKQARKKSASKAAGADDKAKTPRKRGPKKQGTENADADGNQNNSAEEKGGEVVKPTPKKRGPKAKKVAVEGGNGDVDVEDVVEPATPKATPVKKRTPTAKKESTDGGIGLSASTSSKKRASLGEVGGDEDLTPTKKPRAAAKKLDKTKLPTNRSELSEADKLMLELKKEGKTWTEITAAVSELTGLQYGKSTLGVRYGKVMDALMEWKEGDIERMLFVRDKVLEDNEVAIVAFKKDIENKTWANMARAMKELGADEYSPGAVEKAYNREKKEGFPHRATMATVMAGFSSAGGVIRRGGSDAEDEANEVSEMEDLKLEEMGNMHKMDTSADAGTFEV